MQRIAFFAGLAFAFAYGLAQAEEPAKSASPVMRESLTGDPSREIVAITVVLPPVATTGRHTDRGDQYTLVQEGESGVLVEGQPPNVFRAGEGFPITPGVVHENQNASNGSQARTTEFFIVAKDKPRTMAAK
jgi:quercetin dioxygenase-like cupin family protein